MSLRRRTGPVKRLARAAARVLVAVVALPSARGAGPPVVVLADRGVDAAALRRVREHVASRRAVLSELPLPTAGAVSPDGVAVEQRTRAIRLALDRARKHESEAAWDDCVREAAGAVSDAIDVIALAGDLGLLRDLHVAMGACMSLAQNPASARPHFVTAAILDETAPLAGLHREEAERAQAEARAEVLARTRGPVRIESEPSGAEVWIDGRKIQGVTPLDVAVRLGDHFVTLRRFRFEPHTDRRLLQPSGRVRVVLDPAKRATLREQLAGLGAAGTPRPGEEELRLAGAVWARAEQVVIVSRAPGAPITPTVRVRVLDSVTGRLVRAAAVPVDDAAAARRAVCVALGETCDPPPRGVPWYVWPLAGAVLVGAAVTAGFVIDAERDVKFAPPRP